MSLLTMIAAVFKAADDKVKKLHLLTNHGGVGHQASVVSVEFIGLKNGVSVPIGPVHSVPEQGDAEGMLEHFR